MPIFPFSTLPSSSPPKSRRRPSIPSSSSSSRWLYHTPTTSLLRGWIVLPRLRRRVIYLAMFLAVIIYTSAVFQRTTEAVAEEVAQVGRERSLSTGRGGRMRDEGLGVGVEGWLEEMEDGSVVVGAEGGKGKGHPIRQLMLEARHKWDSQLARQSKTLEEAVANYKMRYRRSPPKGFGAWWRFARAHDVVIVDDYDQIHTSITPFLALDPILLGTRLDELLREAPFSYELQIRRNAPVNITGERAGRPRPMQMQRLLEGFREWLPVNFGEGEGDLGKEGGDRGIVRLSGSDHDLGGKIMGADFRERMMDLASRGKNIDREELRVLENVNRPQAISRDLLNACSKDSPAGRMVAGKQNLVLQPEGPDLSVSSEESPVSFIRDPVKSFDFCTNPSLLPFHGTYSRTQARSPTLYPQLVLSKHMRSNQILITPLEAFQNITDRLPWAEKTISKLFWRGSTTGDSFSNRKDYDWRNSHRVRLHKLTNAREGEREVLVESGGEVEMRRFEIGELNAHLMDVGLSAIKQCSEVDGTCEMMRNEIQLAGIVRPSDAVLYRYAFDIDGNGWSSRFRRLIASGNVVLKMTVFPEWNTEWLTPWLHYIPVKVDLSDLYHSATFFMGTPDGYNAHEDLGQTISEAAVKFAEKHWRWVDMQAYMFRLLLEYRRTMAHDRNAMSMGGKLLL